MHSVHTDHGDKQQAADHRALGGHACRLPCILLAGKEATAAAGGKQMKPVRTNVHEKASLHVRSSAGNVCWGQLFVQCSSCP